MSGTHNTKPVVRAGTPMLTVDVQRLRNASPLQTKNPVSRRPFNKVAVILSLLLVIAVAVDVDSRGGSLQDRHGLLLSACRCIASETGGVEAPTQKFDDRRLPRPARAHQDVKSWLECEVKPTEEALGFDLQSDNVHVVPYAYRCCGV